MFDKTKEKVSKLFEEFCQEMEKEICEPCRKKEQCTEIHKKLEKGGRFVALAMYVVGSRLTDETGLGMDEVMAILMDYLMRKRIEVLMRTTTLKESSKKVDYIC